jgi:hypothetical protein
MLTLSAAEPGRLFQDTVPWLLAIIGLAVVGGMVIMIVRRMLRSNADGEAPGFTLQSLRDLRDQGEITEEEFERAREVMIGRLNRDSEKTPPSPASRRSRAHDERDGLTAAGDRTASEHPEPTESDKPEP